MVAIYNQCELQIHKLLSKKDYTRIFKYLKIFCKKKHLFIYRNLTKIERYLYWAITNQTFSVRKFIVLHLLAS